MPSPPDDSTARRMRHAHQQAATALAITLDSTRELCGWEGRSLSGATSDGQWLRLLTAPAGGARGGSWDGPEAAEKAIPDTVPRPRFHTAHEWAEEDHAYRAELYERIQGSSLSDGPLPPPGLRLPDAWWISLKASLAAIA